MEDGSSSIRRIAMLRPAFVIRVHKTLMRRCLFVSVGLLVSGSDDPSEIATICGPDCCNLQPYMIYAIGEAAVVRGSIIYIGPYRVDSREAFGESINPS